MSKQNLNEQLNRIKQLLNINESSVIEEAGNPIMAVVRKLVPGLERKLTKALEGELGKKIANATDQEIETALKSTTMKATRQELAAAIYAVEKNMIDDVFAKYNMSVATEASKAYSELQQNGLNKGILRDIVGEWKAGGKGGSSSLAPTPNPAPKPKPKKEPVLTPDPDAPGPGSKPLKIDDLPPNANDIINGTAKSSTEAAAFMQQIDLLGFNDQITTLLKLSYSQNYRKTIPELVAEGNDLAQMLNEKTYGPLKRLWSRIANNPSGAIEKTGRAGKSLLKWVVILSVLSSGAVITFALRDKIMKGLGLEDESLLPDVKVPDLSKKDDSNKQTSGIDDSVQGLRNFFKQKYDGYDDTAVNALDIKSLGSSKYEVTKDGTKLTFTYSNGTFTRQ